MKLSEKIAIVTGAGSVGDGLGNGNAVALKLAEAGAFVGVLDIMEERAEETVSRIARAGGRALAVSGDVSQGTECASCVGQVVSRFGGLDILVNNVGIYGASGDAVGVPAEDWDVGMAVNVKSVMLMAKYSVPEMARRGGGAIVNISSTAGVMGGNPSLLYPTSKGALINMTRAMAAHHGRSGIRVNCVAPGMVLTPRVQERGLSPDARRWRRNSSLLGTEGTADDVANAVLFLASDYARWITGVTLPVDAGLLAALPHYESAAPGRGDR